MEIIKQLYHSGSLNSFNANWLPQHRGWAARLVVNQRQKGIGPAAALRSTNHNRQHQCSQLGCLSAAGFHGTMGTFWRSHCKRKHKAANQLEGEEDGEGFASQAVMIPLMSSSTGKNLHLLELMTYLQWKPESHLLLQHADTKPGEIPVKLRVFLWISNSEVEEK